MGLDFGHLPSEIQLMKQSAFANFHKPHLAFGGALMSAKTNPKVARPLSSQLPIHLVLRSNRSWMRTPKHFKLVNDTVTRATARHGVRLYQFANVGNHLHLLIKIPNRGRWAKFIRELTGRIAMLRTGGAAWARRPFTRVVNGWRKAFNSVKEYVRLNDWEATNGLNKQESNDFRELDRVWRVQYPWFRVADWDLDCE